MGRKVLLALRLAVLPAIVVACGRPRPEMPAASRSFRHPGVLVTRAHLDLAKARVEAGEEPWTSALAKVRASRWASLEWTPRPRALVECGPYSRPDRGCREEKQDAAAAYAHALLWTLTGDARHARKSAEILGAWSAVIKDHTGHNAPLQSAWVASVFPRAAEILRHTDAGWPIAEADAFAAVLRDVYLPEFAEGAPTSNGNWELSMIEAMLAIAVFTDDRPLFDRAVGMWRRRVPAYFFMSSDGDAPVPAPGGADDTAEKVVKRWYGQVRLVDGLCQETCRDFGHTQYGLAAALNVAETALIQGVDLYGEETARLTAALELHAGLLPDAPVPDWLCGGTLDREVLPTWEIGYNHFAVRQRRPLPATARLIRNEVWTHPTGTDAETSDGSASPHHILWETLTHAGAARAGLP